MLILPAYLHSSRDPPASTSIPELCLSVALSPRGSPAVGQLSSEPLPIGLLFEPSKADPRSLAAVSP